MNKERLVKTFTDLVALDSPSFDEQAVCRYIKERLTALGVQVEEDDSAAAAGSTCGNLLATIPGDPSLEPVLFSAHMDTVEPSRGKQAVTDENGRMTSCGDTVLGADDFAGVSAILEGVASLLESGATHPTLELLFTTGEEHFCVGAKAFDAQRLQSKTAYVMDLSGPVGDCAVAAPTLITFSAEVVGKAAHAGFAPEDGVHAIQVAAAAVANLPSGRCDGKCGHYFRRPRHQHCAGQLHRHRRNSCPVPSGRPGSTQRDSQRVCGAGTGGGRQTEF